MEEGAGLVYRFSDLKRPRSSSLSFSPFLLMDGIFPRKRTSISYNKLPDEPLRLTILKLDGSTFGIKVTKTATVAELKQAVEAAFSHMPRKGTGKISWPHLWGQFCLCYDGQKLITEADYVRHYGIKDGDQLHFIRHVSYTCNLRRRRSKTSVLGSKKLRISLSQVNSYQEKKRGSDGENDYAEIEDSGMHQLKDYSSNHGYKLTRLIGGWFSYSKLLMGRRTRFEGNPYVSKVASGLFGGTFTRIRKIVRLCRKKHYS